LNSYGQYVERTQHCNHPKSQKKKNLQLEILKEKSWKLKIVLKTKTQVVYKLGRHLERTKGFKLE
jgi:hypothetical protein